MTTKQNAKKKCLKRGKKILTTHIFWHHSAFVDCSCIFFVGDVNEYKDKERGRGQDKVRPGGTAAWMKLHNTCSHRTTLQLVLLIPPFQ